MQNNRKLKHRTSHAAFHAAKYAIVLLEFFNQQVVTMCDCLHRKQNCKTIENPLNAYDVTNDRALWLLEIKSMLKIS